MTNHADILARLLPPVAYDVRAPALAAELAVIAMLLDEVLDLTAVLDAELDPRAAYALLDEFEQAFGLPDACAAVDGQTTADRRLALVARMTARGSQHPAYYVALAEALGYPGTRVYEYAPWTCTDTCAEPVAGADWRFVWVMQMPQDERVTYFTAGSPCTEPLANWSSVESIACVVNRLKPAHTTCFFDFGA